MLNASIAIQVLPHVETDEETVRIVDEVIAYIKDTGLSCYVGPFETTVEGEYEALMEIIKNCQYIAVKAGCPSVMSYVKISFKPEGGVLTIDQKFTKHHQEGVRRCLDCPIAHRLAGGVHDGGSAGLYAAVSNRSVESFF